MERDVLSWRIYVVTVLLLGFLSGMTAAQTRVERGYQSLDSTVSRLRERTGGRVLSAETRGVDGRPTHFVRILTPGGKVQRIRVDARSGRRLGTPSPGR